jgi:hypothetical protein
MRNEFLSFLVEEKLLPPDRGERFYKTLQCAPEPIGAIAFRYGLITGADIDDILDEQRRAHRPFGEIAVSKDLLTETQVEALLYIQQLRGATEAAEALALANVCPVERLMTYLGRFLSRPQAITVDRE